MPGIKLVLEVFHCTPGTVDSLAELLKEGQILVGIVIMYNYAAVSCNLNWIEDADPSDTVLFQGLSPGGVYEAQFGDHNYQVLWKVCFYSNIHSKDRKTIIQERLGFARAALQADVPVLPVFTENIRFVTFYVIIHYLNRPSSTIDMMPS